MKKTKKLLAVLSATLISSLSLVTNAAAIYIGREFRGKYYTAEEYCEITEKMKQIKLEIDENYLLEIPDKTTDTEIKNGTDNDLLDINSELYKLLKSYDFDCLQYKYYYDIRTESDDKENEFGVVLITDETVEDLCKKLEEFPEVISATPKNYYVDFPSLGTEIDVISGDLSMDGKVNIVDAVKLAKYNADPTAYPLLTYSQLAADVNGDGELTNADLIALVKMI